MASLDFWFYASMSMIVPAEWEASVADIVAASVARNRLLSVTGALMGTGSRFAQFIEGPPAAIADLRASITADLRHTDLRTVDEGPTEQRKFADWSLAYAGTTPVFDHLVRLCRDLHPSSARVLLAEMIRRFTADSPRHQPSG